MSGPAPVPEPPASLPDAESGEAKRGPGRPIDLAKRQAVVDATLELLAEVGYGALTIDSVAQRAGSNRVLVYRVWDSKIALVRDVLFGTAADLVVPDTGSVVEDLRSYVAQHVARMSHPAYVMGVPGLTIELLSDPELSRDTHRRFIAPSEEGFTTILDRGQQRGELSVRPDPKVVTYVVSGITTSLAQSTRLSEAAITDVVMSALVGGLVSLAHGE